MEAAIHNIDPTALEKLSMSVFTILKESDKRRYVALAKEVTNKTHNELDSVSLSDALRCIKGTLKGSIGMTALLGLYRFYQGSLDFSQWTTFPDKERTIEAQKLTPEERKYMYTFLGAISAYFLYQGYKEFSAIVHRKNRLLRHRNALSNEALLQRLPIYETGTNESVLA